MSNNKLCRVHHPEIVHPRAELPTVPPAFLRNDYEGVLVEALKRIQLRAYQKTQAERLAVLRQIDQLQVQCLTLMRNEAEWRHFNQQDRIRQKRLDIEEIELDMRLEDLQEKRNEPKEMPPAATPRPPRDPVRETLNRLRQKLRAGVEARSECDRLKEEFPESAADIEREFRKMIADLREAL